MATRRNDEGTPAPWFRDEAPTQHLSPRAQPSRRAPFPPLASTQSAPQWEGPVRPRPANQTTVMPALDGPTRRTDPAGPGRPTTRQRAARRRRFRPRWFVIALVMLLLLPVALLFIADQRLERHSVWPTAARPAATPGADWLIVGSDSREGLSDEERRQLRTGSAYGARTDTIMLMHIGEAGPTLVSLPRDSYVPIPGHGSNKLNAAYAIGGPKLLVQTVESLTQIRIDHYAEIGMGGLFDLVNTLGGVTMCPKQAINDAKAGLNIKAGCQEFDGQDALGYGRSRQFTRGDLDRIGHQRELITAIVDKAASPTTLLNPLKAWGLATKGPSTVAVADGDHITDLAKLAWAGRSLNSDGVTTTVPIGGETRNSAGWVVTWHPTRSKALFDALRADKPVPSTAISA